MVLLQPQAPPSPPAPPVSPAGSWCWMETPQGAACHSSSGNQSSHDTSTRHHPPANCTISFVSLQRWKAKSTVWTEGGDTAAHKTTSTAIQSPAVKALPETSHLRLRNGRLLRAHKLSQPPVAVWTRQIPKQGSVLGSRGRSDRVNPKPLRASLPHRVLISPLCHPDSMPSLERTYV